MLVLLFLNVLHQQNLDWLAFVTWIVAFVLGTVTGAIAANSIARKAIQKRWPQPMSQVGS